MDNYSSPYDKGNSTRNKPSDGVSRNNSLPAIRTNQNRQDPPPVRGMAQYAGGSDIRRS
jgi:hypothetical protein